MPVCCKCNSSGLCKKCSCTKAGRFCTDCLPSRTGRCQNSSGPVGDANTSVRDADTSVHDAALAVASVPDTSTHSLDCDAFLSDSFVVSQPDCSSVSSLPLFDSSSPPTFSWGCFHGVALHDVVFKCYNEAICWTRNLFKIPSGKSGTMFVKELVRLIRAYAEGSSMESFALSAAMLMPILLLQKPHCKSKAKEHSTISLRRFDLWGEGKFDELMAESRQIQKCFNRDHTKWEKASDRKALSFAKLVMEGKLKAAIWEIWYYCLS